MKFYTWDQRVAFLEHLANIVKIEFPEVNSYNIFVFGSFLRKDYDPEKSDLDLAVYAKTTELTFAIVDFLDAYLSKNNINNSLLEIFLDQLDAYVVVKPLGLNIAFTDYYPDELKLYFRTVQRRAIFYNMDAESVNRVQQAIID